MSRPPAGAVKPWQESAHRARSTLAFYRRLGVNLPEADVWRTDSGAHHASVRDGDADLDLDSTRFAAIWTPSSRIRTASLSA